MSVEDSPRSGQLWPVGSFEQKEAETSEDSDGSTGTGDGNKTPSSDDSLRGRVTTRGFKLENCLGFGHDTSGDEQVVSLAASRIVQNRDQGESESSTAARVFCPKFFRNIQKLRERANQLVRRWGPTQRIASASQIAQRALFGSRPILGQPFPAKVRLTQDAMETTRLKLEMIKKAEHSIELSGNYAGGKVFDVFLDAIHERMQKCSGLKTHIIVADDYLTPENRKKLANLKRDYPDRFFALPTKRKFLSDGNTEINHVKALVVDREFFCVGGTGIIQNLCRENKTDTVSDILRTEKQEGEEEETEPVSNFWTVFG